MPDNFNDYPATLAARISHLEAAREQLLAELEGAATGQANTGKWSAADIAYHLYLVERGIGRMLKKALSPEGARHERKTEEDLRAEWQRISRLGDPTFHPVSAPAPVEPVNAPSLGESLSLLSQSRCSLLDTLAATTMEDLASISRPHLLEVMGRLTGAGWLSMIAYHELRHTAQLRRLKG